MNELPADLIFEIARDAGIEAKGKGDKRTCRCRFHEDRHASAFLVGSTNCFGCAVCTPGGGWSAKTFSEKLGLDWQSYTRGFARAPQHKPIRAEPPPFTAADAQSVWKVAYARARDDEAVEDGREVYDFLSSRGLMEASEYGVFGIVSTDMTLPGGVKSWPRRGYRLVAPLYDHAGDIVSLQSRSVRGCDPKTLAPTGGRLAGSVFADERGLAVLRGEAPATNAMIYGEGLTDYLALSIASPVPVLTVPGTNNTVAGVGDWARGRAVILGLDCDNAGEEQVEPASAALRVAGARRVLALRWPPGCKDACDVVAQRGTAGLHALLVNKLARASA